MVRRVTVQQSIIGVSALVAAVGIGYCLVLPGGAEPESVKAYPVEKCEPVIGLEPLPVILPEKAHASAEQLVLASAQPSETESRWFEASEPSPQLEAFPPIVANEEPAERTAFLPASTDRVAQQQNAGRSDWQEAPAEEVCEYNNFPSTNTDDQTVSVLMNDPIGSPIVGPEIGAFADHPDNQQDFPVEEELDFGSPTVGPEIGAFANHPDNEQDFPVEEELDLGSPNESFAEVAPAPQSFDPTPDLASDFSPPSQEKFDVPPPVAAPIDVQQIEIRARHLIEEGVDRFDRRMLASAKTRFVGALRVVSQSLDAQTEDNRHTVALAEGIRAMKEAEDFSPHGSRLEGDVNVAMKVASHRTPVLKEASKTNRQITPMAAIQAYYQFAQQRLADACGQQPVASEALFAWGRVELAEKQQNNGHALSETKAMALYQSSLMVDSRNQRAANELGVALARFGKLASARDVLRHSVATAPSRESWQNLAEVHARLGEHEMSKLAHQEMVALANGPRSPVTQNNSVQWLTPEQFAGGQQMTASAPPAVAPEPVYQAAPWWMPWRR